MEATLLHCGPEASIPDWIIEYPETSRIFDEFRLDSSCGGKSLEYVCEQEGVDIDCVLVRLEQVVESS